MVYIVLQVSTGFLCFFHYREGPKVMDISDVHFLVRVYFLLYRKIYGSLYHVYLLFEFFHHRALFFSHWNVNETKKPRLKQRDFTVYAFLSKIEHWYKPKVRFFGIVFVKIIYQPIKALYIISIIHNVHFREYCSYWVDNDY